MANYDPNIGAFAMPVPHGTGYGDPYGDTFEEYGNMPPEDYEVESMSPLAAQEMYPDAFGVDMEALEAIERGEKTPLQKKEEFAASMGMTLQEYLTEEAVAKDRAAWNASVRKGINPKTGEKLEGGAFEPPRTEKYGYGEYGSVEKIHPLGYKFGDKPPDDWQVPDYSPEGRKDFENWIFNQKLGFNPFTMNIPQMVEQIANQHKPQIFAETFGGQVRYQDRHKMTKQQKDHWQKQVNALRAFIEKDLESQKQAGQWTYNQLMKGFDDRANEVKGNLDKLDKYLDANVTMHNPEKGIIDYNVSRKDVADMEREGWIKGKPMNDKDYDSSSDSAKIGDLKKVFDMINKALTDSTGNGQMKPEYEAVINQTLTSLELPTLYEIVGVDEDDEINETWGSKVKEFFIKEFPGMGYFLKGVDIVMGKEGESSAKPTPSKTAAPTESNVILDQSTGQPLKAVDQDGNPLKDGFRANSAAGPIVVAGGYWYKAE